MVGGLEENEFGARLSRDEMDYGTMESRSMDHDSRIANLDFLEPTDHTLQFMTSDDPFEIVDNSTTADKTGRLTR